MQLRTAEKKLAEQERQAKEYLSAAREAISLAEEAKQKAAALEIRLQKRHPGGDVFAAAAKSRPLPAKSPRKSRPPRADAVVMQRTTEAMRAQKARFNSCADLLLEACECGAALMTLPCIVYCRYHYYRCSLPENLTQT